MEPSAGPSTAKATEETTEESPVLKLTGNYYNAEIKGYIFPKSPPFIHEGHHVVDNNVCIATEGVGRLFVPQDLLDELSEHSYTEDVYWISAAPGLQHRKPFPITNEVSREDVISKCVEFYEWHYKSLIAALKPIEDIIPKSDLHLFRGTNFYLSPKWVDIFEMSRKKIDADVLFKRGVDGQMDADSHKAADMDVASTFSHLRSFKRTTSAGAKIKLCLLDNKIEMNKLDQSEIAKLNHVRINPVYPNEQPYMAHGTKMFKTINEIVGANTKIDFYSIGKRDGSPDFFEVMKALEHIALTSKGFDTVLVNCSFSCVPGVDSSDLFIGDFFAFHEMIHKLGFVLFGAAGNSGSTVPHDPWGRCESCIVVGAHDTSDVITSFSAGCCTERISTFTNGVKFRFSSKEPAKSGTSFATAVVSASIANFAPSIWKVDDWKTFGNTVKNFIKTHGRKRIGCDSEEMGHKPQQWKQFTLPSTVPEFKIMIGNVLVFG